LINRTARLIYINTRNTNIILITLLLIVLISAALNRHPGEDRMILSYAVANRLIVIDAGHGGEDPGAVRPGCLPEKDITLAIAKKLEKYLSEAGAIVINLRQDDKDLAGEDFQGSLSERKRKDLTERIAIANNQHADLFISIHVNADPSPRWYGAQTFYKMNDEASKQLAESIQRELKQNLKNTKREAKAGSYYLIDRTKMPTVLVEVGFISNPQEAALLQNDEYQSRVAYAIYQGIVKNESERLQNGN